MSVIIINMTVRFPEKEIFANCNLQTIWFIKSNLLVGLLYLQKIGKLC